MLSKALEWASVSIGTLKGTLRLWNGCLFPQGPMLSKALECAPISIATLKGMLNKAVECVSVSTGTLKGMLTLWCRATHSWVVPHS
jgi:hypothetical protein